MSAYAHVPSCMLELKQHAYPWCRVHARAGNHRWNHLEFICCCIWLWAIAVVATPQTTLVIHSAQDIDMQLSQL